MIMVELTPEKLAELKQNTLAAQEQGPSPWKFRKIEEEYRTFYEVRDDNGCQVAYDLTQEDAKHIAAADPATVLALLQKIERLQKIADNNDYPDPVTQEESFLKNIQGTIKLHKLDRDGLLDSPEADEIRDDLDAHWYNLTKKQQDTIGEISERLYQLESTRKI